MIRIVREFPLIRGAEAFPVRDIPIGGRTPAVPARPGKAAKCRAPRDAGVDDLLRMSLSVVDDAEPNIDRAVCHLALVQFEDDGQQSPARNRWL